MSIVAIISSPRKGANTDAMVRAAAEGARENGKDVQIFELNAMKDRRGCQGCDGCKRNGGTCITKDDLAPVLDAIRGAEGLIVSSPVYFGEACAQYRLLEDRFYGYLKADFSTSLEAGKKALIFTAAGTGGEQALADKMAKVLGGFFKFDVVGTLAVATGNDRKYVESHPDIVAKARELGKKL